MIGAQSTPYERMCKAQHDRIVKSGSQSGGKPLLQPRINMIRFFFRKGREACHAGKAFARRRVKGCFEVCTAVLPASLQAGVPLLNYYGNLTACRSHFVCRLIVWRAHLRGLAM